MNDKNKRINYKKLLEQFSNVRQENETTDSGGLFDKTTSQGQEWLTTNQAACYLNVSPSTLRNMVSNGQVTYYKLGRRNRYKLSDLCDLLQQTKRGGSYAN